MIITKTIFSVLLITISLRSYFILKQAQALGSKTQISSATNDYFKFKSQGKIDVDGKGAIEMCNVSKMLPK